jgi:hypothetical protein
MAYVILRGNGSLAKSIWAAGLLTAVVIPDPNAPVWSNSVAAPTAAQCESACTPIQSPIGNRANPTVRSPLI